MAGSSDKEPNRDSRTEARLALLRAQQGGGLLGIGQNAPASEAVRAKQTGDDWRPPLPAPMSGFGMAIAIAVLAMIVVLFVLMA
jgi:hypothetical protein